MDTVVVTDTVYVWRDRQFDRGEVAVVVLFWLVVGYAIYLLSRTRSD